MIGNDVVDLALARRESNWQRRGFLQKLFTETEQSWILEAGEPEKMVWLLWSIKEAAYKIYNRETGLRQFSPLSFLCEKPELKTGTYYAKVKCDRYSLNTKSYVSEDFIATESYFNKEVITYFISNYEDYLNKKIIYKNSLGQPFIKGDIPVSIAHHGRFCIVSTYFDVNEILFKDEAIVGCSTSCIPVCQC